MNTVTYHKDIVMKLRYITEAGISRREFVKRGVGTLSTLLISRGIPQEIARGFTDNKTVYLSRPISYNFDFGAPLEDGFKTAFEYFQTLSKLGPVKFGSAGDDAPEDLFATVAMPASEAARFLGTLNLDEPEEYDGDIFFSTSDNTGTWRLNASADAWEADGAVVKNFMRSWWDQWAQYGVNSMSDKFFGILKANGINPTAREESVKEQIADLIANPNRYASPEEFGDPAKYGVTPEHLENAKRQRTEYEQQFDKPKNEVERIEPTLDDQLSNPMHQSFESRLRAALAII